MSYLGRPTDDVCSRLYAEDIKLRQELKDVEAKLLALDREIEDVHRQIAQAKSTMEAYGLGDATHSNAAAARASDVRVDDEELVDIAAPAAPPVRRRRPAAAVEDAGRADEGGGGSVPEEDRPLRVRRKELQAGAQTSLFSSAAAPPARDAARFVAPRPNENTDAREFEDILYTISKYESKEDMIMWYNHLTQKPKWFALGGVRMKEFIEKNAVRVGGFRNVALNVDVSPEDLHWRDVAVSLAPYFEDEYYAKWLRNWRLTSEPKNIEFWMFYKSMRYEQICDTIKTLPISHAMKETFMRYDVRPYEGGAAAGTGEEDAAEGAPTKYEFDDDVILIDDNDFAVVEKREGGEGAVAAAEVAPDAEVAASGGGAHQTEKKRADAQSEIINQLESCEENETTHALIIPENLDAKVQKITHATNRSHINESIKNLSNFCFNLNTMSEHGGVNGWRRGKTEVLIAMQNWSSTFCGGGDGRELDDAQFIEAAKQFRKLNKGEKKLLMYIKSNMARCLEWLQNYKDDSVFVCCYETSKSMSPYMRVTHVLNTNDELASLGGKDDSPSPFVFEKIIHKKSFMAPAEITHPESAKQKKEKPPRKSAGATAKKKHAAPPAAAAAEGEKARDDDDDDDFGLFDQGDFVVGDAESDPDPVPATELPAADDEEEEEDDIMERIRKRARAGAANVGRRLGKMCLH